MNLRLNESTLDRAIRVVLGAILVALALFGGVAAPLIYVVWAVAAIALVTGVIGFCPLYALFRFSTRAR